MKFDCIIMNPPYQRNLHLKILAKAITHLKDNDSVCVNLSPEFMQVNELHILTKTKKYLFSRIVEQQIKDSKEIDKIFGIYSANNLAITHFQKNINTKNIFPESSIDQIIVKKFRDRSKTRSIRTMIHQTNGNFLVPVQGDYGYAKRWHYTLKEMLSGNPTAKIKFKTQFEADNFIKITTTAKPYKFIYIIDEKSAIPAHLPFMGDVINPRTGLKGYESEWTDEDFYTYFNITSDEQKIIEDTMAKYIIT